MTNANTTPRAMIGDIPVFCAFDEIIPTAKAVPNPQNPNKHPDKQINLLAEIIKQQGWRAPITISNRSGYIVRGHGRLLAAQLLGTESVPVDFQNYESDAAERADMIADNRLSEFSDLDEDILAELLNEINDSDFDIELAGFDFEELEKYLDSEDLAMEDETFSYETPTNTTPAAPPAAFFEPSTEASPPNDPFTESYEKKQGQTGEINLDEYAEERYTHECPKCKFKW